MHPDMDDLLALRDGDGTAEVASHVERCPRCAAAIDELQSTAAALRELPPIASGRDHWPEIKRRVVERRRKSFAVRTGAVAAAIVAAVGIASLVRSPVATVPPGPANADARTTLDELAAASRGLEAVLRDPGLQRQVLSPRRAAVIVDLEDRLAIVDRVLADQPTGQGADANVALWSHRVELLDALVAARTGEPTNQGPSYAVIQYEGSQP